MENTTEQKPPQTEPSMPENLHENLDMLYPPSIVEWELKHNIVREIKNGMMYIRCTDWDAFNRQLEEEKAERRRQALKMKIAQQQAAAYLGEQEKMAL